MSQQNFAQGLLLLKQQRYALLWTKFLPVKRHKGSERTRTFYKTLLWFFHIYIRMYTSGYWLVTENISSRGILSLFDATWSEDTNENFCDTLKGPFYFQAVVWVILIEESYRCLYQGVQTDFTLRWEKNFIWNIIEYGTFQYNPNSIRSYYVNLISIWYQNNAGPKLY